MSNPDKMEPGVTSLSLYRWEEPYGPPNLQWGVVVIVDESGDILWYLRIPYLPNELRRMLNGNFFISSHGPAGRLMEFDMRGNLVNGWLSKAAQKNESNDHRIAVNTDRFHHDIIELPSQNLMGLSAEARKF